MDNAFPMKSSSPFNDRHPMDPMEKSPRDHAVLRAASIVAPQRDTPGGRRSNSAFGHRAWRVPGAPWEISRECQWIGFVGKIGTGNHQFSQ